MSLPWLTYVPEAQQADALRLAEISPWFVSLMRQASEAECLQLFQPADQAQLPQKNQEWFPEIQHASLSDALTHLRQLKRRAMRFILWWELGVHGDIEASYHSITVVAEALIGQAVELAKQLMIPRFGSLPDASFCVIGLGKLGGRELNLGSDVDPLFIWQGVGQTEGGRSIVAANEYFANFAKMLMKLLAEQTGQGVVWPVDMRLRPGGDGAPICLSLNATLSHYLDYGQTWERAMLIKARPVAGDLALGQMFIEGVAPFVYRRYMDYSTVVALADMKCRIDQQAGQASITSGFDVKRGKGGIREIEFTIQSMQLLHGGRDVCLREQEGRQALVLLVQQGLMDKAEADALMQAYCFWRQVEHALQARKGEQTHALPADFDSYLSSALSIKHITAPMLEYQHQVNVIFAARVLPQVQRDEHHVAWLNAGIGQAEVEHLSSEKQQRIVQALQRVDAQLLRGLLPERSRAQVEKILDMAMPEWLADHNGVQALEYFSELLHNIAGRASWVDLLASHQGALRWLIGVLSASRYLAEHIVKNPTWLEWPLREERNANDIQDLCLQIQHLDVEDEADFLANLGRLVDLVRIHCALAIDAHHAEPLAIGAWLADVADAAVFACLRSSIHALQLPTDFPLLAIALGKHGSREMGLVSDLDMVFVLAGDADLLIANKTAREWSQRLGRRMIRQLTGVPPFGAGFEFDARLRPSGQSGVLVTTLVGFSDYQREHAQTWEHQALTRARVITGSQDLQQQLQTIIHQTLNQKRDIQVLKADVLIMREKMLMHLGSKDSATINLKHDAGGLVDIEFLAQFVRLAYADAARHGGTIHTLQHLPRNTPSSWQPDANMLAQTYLDYRQMENALRVELWDSVGRLAADPQHTHWETMRRHAAIHTPDVLRARMLQVRTIFLDWLSSNN